MIKCLIWDLDDTLYYEKEYVLEAFKNVCKYLSSKYKKDYDKVYKRCIKILDEYGRGKIFNILCDEYGFKEDIKKLVEIYRDTKPKLELYEESKEIFNFAKENNLKLGLITDGCSKVQWNKIKALNLEKIIDKIIVTDDYGYGYSKPHEKSYTEIIEYFNIKPEECVYIGDNPNKDFIGAKKLGMKTIRIIHENGDHINDKTDIEFEAELKIRKLSDIVDIIQ
ncbi:HAD family hydrolase [Clostridium neonatale]|uniref:HAD family hydrolase n=1 Tax=Clostridium neonatale TaxID=137838 RepID=UPI00291B4A10|nr:putative haloacid dehalogenase (HAD) [Clostridium neonatale]